MIILLFGTFLEIVIHFIHVSLWGCFCAEYHKSLHAKHHKEGHHVKERKVHRKGDYRIPVNVCLQLNDGVHVLFCLCVYVHIVLHIFMCLLCQWTEQVNLLFVNIIRESAIAIATCSYSTRTKALNPLSYISWYLCMKWSFTIASFSSVDVSASSHPQVQLTLLEIENGKGLVHQRMVLQRAMHTNTSTSEHFPFMENIFPCSLSCKRYFKTWMKSKWNLNIRLWQCASLMPRVACVHSIASS